MNRRLLIAVSLLVALSACTSATVPHGTLYQVSLASALVERDYEGETTLGELLRHGDFGLGTVDRLDGELIVLKGTAYKARSDGSVVEVPPDETTPFAVITRFRTDSQISIDQPMGIRDLERLIDRTVDNPNLFYALRIDARIPAVTVRSVPAQSPPFRNLVEVVAEQRTWTREDVSGTIVGFRSPPYVGTMNVPGYHWHFLSDDRSQGGHVLSATLDRGAVDIDPLRTWIVVLPSDRAFGKLDLAKDHRDELEVVEKSGTE
ncbi:MAG: acetolactate decarboxylase [Polyangiales bacterium]